MREIMDGVLAGFGGVAGRREFLREVSRASFDDEVRQGHLIAIFPRAYARPWDVDLPDTRLRASLASVGGEVALSHVTALGQWGLPVAQDGPIHLTAYNPRHPRGVPNELVVHRTLLPLRPREVAGLPVVPVEVALVTSWPLLAGSQGRAPLIEASRRRLVSARSLAEVAEKMSWVRGIRQFREVVGLLLAGCESELELWGYTDVFDVPGLDDATRQRVVRVGGRIYRLDMAYEEQMLAVELDGRAYHAGTDRWEQDIARDLALATVGWQTIRLSHHRLTNDVAGCRRDVLAVRSARRGLTRRRAS